MAASNRHAVSREAQLVSTDHFRLELSTQLKSAAAQGRLLFTGDQN
jgi:hypothetical protein